MNKIKIQKSLEKKASWELQKMKKALSSILSVLNTDEENYKIEVINEILNKRGKNV